MDSIHIMATKPKTMITPRAKYPDRTEKFLTDVKVALETLEDEVGSLSEHTRSGAYKNFLESYRDALIPLWNPARFASVKTVLETVANPQMTDLAVMARRLQPSRVFAAATFSKLERHYFDETMSHVDVARQFKCNVSQLSKTLTGVDYASGPHHYKPKAKKQATKRTDTSDPNPRPVKKTSNVPEKSDVGTVLKSPAAQEDTLSSSSSSDELPMGLL